MKMMKKLLSIIMAALLLAAAGAAAVSAEEPAQPDMEALHQKFIAYLDEQGVEHSDPSMGAPSVTFIMESNGWNVFKGIVWPIADMCIMQNIGQYVFYTMGMYRPYQFGVYAEKDGVILTLKEAHDEGRIDIDEIAQYILNGNLTNVDLGVRWIGDTNADNVINIADVLNIQKLIAKKIYGLEDVFANPDFNKDGEINVADVLDIQKRIAKVS